MIEWLKNKTILILGGLLVLSVVGNIVFGWIFFKQGLKITKNEYITNTSNAYASSGSLSLNILGQQMYYNGKWVLKEKQFIDFSSAFEFISSQDICTWELTKIIVTKNTVFVIYPEFVTQISEKKGSTSTTKKEDIK
jgi:hypothetical protein